MFMHISLLISVHMPIHRYVCSAVLTTNCTVDQQQLDLFLLFVVLPVPKFQIAPEIER